MSKIFDNIETKFEEGLHAILTNVGVRVKPCEGCDKGDVKKHNGIRCRVMDWETGKPVLFMPPFDFKPIEG